MSLDGKVPREVPLCHGKGKLLGINNTGKDLIQLFLGIFIGRNDRTFRYAAAAEGIFNCLQHVLWAISGNGRQPLEFFVCHKVRIYRNLRSTANLQVRSPVHQQSISLTANFLPVWAESSPAMNPSS